MGPRFILYIGSPEDREAAIRAAGGPRNVVWCETVAEVVAAAHAELVTGILWEIRADEVAQVLAGITVVLGAFPALAQMVRFEPTPAMATAISELAKISTEPYLSIRGFSEIKSGIEQLTRAHTERAVELLLIKRVLESLIPDVARARDVHHSPHAGQMGHPRKKTRCDL